MVFENDVANRLVLKLGLSVTPSKDTMKKFAARTRELQGEVYTVDQAAMMAAKEIFPSDFKEHVYAGVRVDMETLLADIERL
jgi:hypothetical protein